MECVHWYGSGSCDGQSLVRPGFKPKPRQSHNIRYALNLAQFISDESSAEMVLYLCEYKSE